jgi:hypothetical protein
LIKNKKNTIMSWTDPCRDGCGGTRADCFCEELNQWLVVIKKEQEYYPLFKGRDLDEEQLRALWREGKSPIDALNDLSTLC